jgi:hypothetical protein
VLRKPDIKHLEKGGKLERALIDVEVREVNDTLPIRIPDVDVVWKK